MGSADVVRSAEMNEPTEPWGQPVPPYAIELMYTSVGLGITEDVALAEAVAVTETPRTGFAAAGAMAAARATVTTESRENMLISCKDSLD